MKRDGKNIFLRIESTPSLPHVVTPSYLNKLKIIFNNFIN